jgi:hypothetical protein
MCLERWRKVRTRFLRMGIFQIPSATVHLQTGLDLPCVEESEAAAFYHPSVACHPL